MSRVGGLTHREARKASSGLLADIFRILFNVRHDCENCAVTLSALGKIVQPTSTWLLSRMRAAWSPRCCNCIRK